MTKIIHLHYNVKKNVNIGDEAHVLAIQDSMRSMIDDLSIIDMPISFLSKYQLPSWVFYSRAVPLLLQNMSRVLRGKSYYGLIRDMNRADLVLIGGGGVYINSLLPFNVNLIDKIKTPVVIIGAGYNRNIGSTELNNEQLESIAKLGHIAKLQSVRDVNTVNLLNKVNVKSELMCDPAIFLTPIECRWIGQSNGMLNIGLNIAYHGWSGQDKYIDNIIDSYVLMAKLISGSMSVNFYYFVHHSSELSIVDKLVAKGLNISKAINYDARTTKGVYAKMDFVISMMLHSSILAFGEGVPTLCIGYDDKNISFMEMSNQQDSFINVDDLSVDLLMLKINEIVNSIDLKKQNIKNQYSDLKNKYENFVDTVIDITNRI